LADGGNGNRRSRAAAPHATGLLLDAGSKAIAEGNRQPGRLATDPDGEKTVFIDRTDMLFRGGRELRADTTKTGSRYVTHAHPDVAGTADDVGASTERPLRRLL
jgi:hypothetical protein